MQAGWQADLGLGASKTARVCQPAHSLPTASAAQDAQAEQRHAAALDARRHERVRIYAHAHTYCRTYLERRRGSAAVECLMHWCLTTVAMADISESGISSTSVVPVKVLVPPA